MRFNYFTSDVVATDTDTNAESVATIAAKAEHRIYITGVTVSSSGTPAAAVLGTIKSATTLLDHFQIPAAEFATIRLNYVAPLRCGINEAAILTLPALGAGITSAIAIHGFYVRE